MTQTLHAIYIDARICELEYNLPRRTFFHWIAQGKLSAYRPSTRKTLVKREEVERLIEATRVGGMH